MLFLILKGELSNEFSNLICCNRQKCGEILFYTFCRSIKINRHVFSHFLVYKILKEMQILQKKQ